MLGRSHVLSMALLAAAGCASGDGGGSRADASGMDADVADDAGRRDAGRRDAGREIGEDGGIPDAGPAIDASDVAGTCGACEVDLQCGPGAYCVDLPAGMGGRACLPACNPDVPDCPPRFNCVVDFTAGLPEPVCAPIGERCCVDPDGDLHGSGIGCEGGDCNEDDTAVHEGADETCDGADEDCDTRVDEGDSDALCVRGEHVATSACEDGTCVVASCEPGFRDCNMDPADGCERSVETVSDCSDCGVMCAPAHATGDCSSGTCEIDECEAGWADCNRDPTDGCETPTNTLTDCGGCGIPCAHPRGLSSCATGTCELVGCDLLWDDCDMRDDNGCETSVTTNANCGGCGVLCAPSRGTGDCSTGTCRIIGCTAGFDDCNLDATDGCETSLRSLDACGACGLTCDHAHGSSSCASGTCTLTGCELGWGDCDGIDGNGCEESLRTTTSCGTCGTRCAGADATTSCSTGTCAITSCASGHSNCDGVVSNGCEVDHTTVSGACGGGTDAGAYDGDRSCGFVCGGNTGWDNFATYTGRSSRWFKARVREDSNCSADIEHRVRLEVPPGVDYDLYVYRGAGCTLVGSSVGLTGADEEVIVREAESTASSDSFDYFVEVRYFSGASCSSWTLRLDGHDC